MSTTTTNLGLTKPSGNEHPNVDVINGNMDIIDSAVAGKAASSHSHAASDITSGQLGIANGGTGASTAAGAKANIVDGQALAPASVTATGAVKAVKNNVTYSLGDVGEQLSNKMPYSEINLSGSGWNDQSWATAVHNAMGNESGIALVKYGPVALVIQQGGDPNYYSLLSINYSEIAWFHHYGSGASWVKKTIIS